MDILFPFEPISLNNLVCSSYVTGSTSTSIWKNYQNGVRNYCGHELPEGLTKNQKLWKNLLTPTTKEEEHDSWNRSFVSTVSSHECEEILDPSYTPQTQEENDLFAAKQKFMYSVFDYTLQTDKGKDLERKFEGTKNAQAVYRELDGRTIASSHLATTMETTLPEKAQTCNAVSNGNAFSPISKRILIDFTILIFWLLHC